MCGFVKTGVNITSVFDEGKMLKLLTPDTLLKELKTDGNSLSFVLLATALTSEGQKNERIKHKKTKERKKRRKKKKR